MSFHEEDPAYIRNNGIHAGKASAYYGIGGSAREAEITLVQRDLQLALETGACVNIQHISTKEAVELVRQAKRKGADVHAEATPHHFTLNQEAAIAWGTLAKMNPPLREEEDRLNCYRSCAPQRGRKSEGGYGSSKRYYRSGNRVVPGISGAGCKSGAVHDGADGKNGASPREDV